MDECPVHAKLPALCPHEASGLSFEYVAYLTAVYPTFKEYSTILTVLAKDSPGHSLALP
jgi:hypothetical protein